MSTAYLARSKLFDARAFRKAVDDGPDLVAVYRQRLDTANDALRDAYRDGVSSADLVAGRAWLVDQLLVEAWTHFMSDYPIDDACLAPVGGYGRSELHPGSDIDLLLLLRKEPGDAMRESIEAFMRFLWDIGLEVGHSVRTVSECVTQAKSDITIITNLMEGRHLVGSGKLFEQMIKATGPKKIWSARKFFEAKKTEQQERHLRFEETGYNLEPNLKEGPGGLRDIHVIGWVATRIYEVNTLRELIDHDFLTEDEHRMLIRGRNFLWRLRCGLHFLTDRSEDRLLFDHQRKLAAEFGYEDRPDSLAVEQLMKRYYRTVKDLALLNEILLQHLEEATFARAKPRKRRINRRFESIDGYLDTSDPKVFSRFPFAMLELFNLLQLDDSLKGVRAKTIREIRAHLSLIDPAFRSDLRCRSLFMEIMRSAGGQTHALRRMNAYGVLGAYLPAFGHIVGQMQHDLFHVYTVDAHTMFVLRNTRRFCFDRHAEDHPLANEIMARLIKKERLYLGALFHDIAKGRGGDHSELGEKDAYQFCKQHDMSDYDASLVAWLVRYHLKMSWTAQREDISDPEVIAQFAAIVGDQEHLDYLYLLTIADMRGTNPAVWNDWKARLLQDLYRHTSRHLHLGLGVAEEIEQRVSDRKRDATAALAESGLDKAAVKRLWDQLDPEYFARHGANTIAWHTREIATAAAIDMPIVRARSAPETGATQVFVYAPDTEELLLRTTAGFQRGNSGIVDARFHTARAGFALCALVVLDSSGKALAGEDERNALCKRIADEILRDTAERYAPRPPASRSIKAFPIEPRVAFADQNSELDSDPDHNHTVMEVVAQDRPGLLHQVATALLESRVVLRSARISTYGERAEDVFFVTNRDGEPVNDPEQRETLANAVLTSLQHTDTLAKVS